MNKVLIATILAFSVGFLTKSFVSKNNDSTPSTPTEECVILDKAKSDLINISKSEYLEYSQIKDLKQKYEKADELLGKIMLLFLADVGFRVQQASAIETPPTNTLQTPPPLNTFENSTAPIAAPVYESKEATQVNAGLVGKSNLIRSLKSEEQIQLALNSSIIDSPQIESAKASLISQQQVKSLEGRFTGQIKFIDTKREPIDLVWEFQPDYSKSIPSGSYKFSILGIKRRNETTGNGNIENIKSLADDKNGLIIRACGDECYFQFYYNAASDQFYGNFYESIKGTNKSARVGFATLKK